MNWQRIRDNWVILTTASTLVLAMIAAHFQVWANDERLDDLEKESKAFTELEKATAVIQNQQKNDSESLDDIKVQQQMIMNLLLEIRNQ